jgi:uncharacterized protein
MAMSRKKKIAWGVAGLFVVANVVAYQHAYKFTHFTGDVARTRDPKELSPLAKAGLLFTGIDNPHPQPKAFPTQPYETVKVKSTTLLDCWHIKKAGAKGTVLMFHGYAGEKSSLLGRADVWLDLGYSVFMVDFMGSGGSVGNKTSIGYTEADQVRDCFNYIQGQGEKEIVLFGTSMGAAAVLKALKDNTSVKPAGIVLECPFGSLYRTVAARFELMNVPAFPMAGLLCFWGGVQNGYWAFSHNPAAYAKSVTCPTLLMFGEQDNRVGVGETQEIFDNLQGPKTYAGYANEGHNVFSDTNRQTWVTDVTTFMATLP